MADDKDGKKDDQKKEPSAAQTFAQFFEVRRLKFAKMVPDGVSGDKLQQAALIAYSRGGSNLWQCDMAEVYARISEAAGLGLEIGTGPSADAFLAAFYSEREKRYVCNLMIGWQGLVKIVRRSGEVTAIRLMTVHENDKFEWIEGTGAKIVHSPTLDEPGKVIAATSVVKFKDGTEDFHVMRRSDLDKRRAKARDGGKSGPWADWYEEMAKKSVFRRHFKVLPKRAQDLEALSRIEGDDDIDDLPPTEATGAVPASGDGKADATNPERKALPAGGGAERVDATTARNNKVKDQLPLA